MEYSKYSKLAICFHWMTVVLISIMFAIGWYMVELPSGSDRSFFFALHKSLGLTVFVLVLFRGYWRIINRPPELPIEIGKFRRQAALTVHTLFYVFLILQPVTGYLSSTFSGYKTNFFAIPLPHWGWNDPSLNEVFTTLHIICSMSLVFIIGLHIMGALLHWVEGHSHILRRMWFW